MMFCAGSANLEAAQSLDIDCKFLYRVEFAEGLVITTCVFLGVNMFLSGPHSYGELE
jgi:hypothetical protein